MQHVASAGDRWLEQLLLGVAGLEEEGRRRVEDAHASADRLVEAAVDREVGREQLQTIASVWQLEQMRHLGVLLGIAHRAAHRVATLEQRANQVATDETCGTSDAYDTRHRWWIE